MKYYFSGPTARLKYIKTCKVKHLLISYTYFKTAQQVLDLYQDHDDMIVDSGAFTAWNIGKELNIDDYISFCLKLPHRWNFINLDKIPETGSDIKEIENCAEISFLNYIKIKSALKNVIPVFHYGEDFKHLERYMKETDFIGVSPANDTHETVKRRYLSQCFLLNKGKFRFHGLGYSSESGLEKYPFYSVDSISWLRATIRKSTGLKAFPNSKTGTVLYDSINKYIKLENYITRLWQERGVIYDA